MFMSLEFPLLLLLLLLAEPPSWIIMEPFRGVCASVLVLALDDGDMLLLLLLPVLFV